MGEERILSKLTSIRNNTPACDSTGSEQLVQQQTFTSAVQEGTLPQVILPW